MTQEDRELLLKDICARLQYGVIVSVTDGTIKYEAYIESVSYKNIQVSPVSDSNFTAYTFYKISEIKPYLRPMSSMTEEEENLFSTFRTQIRAMNNYNDFAKECNKLIHWLNKNMFDYRGLIPKGLALEARKGMYKVEEQQ